MARNTEPIHPLPELSDADEIMLASDAFSCPLPSASEDWDMYGTSQSSGGRPVIAQKSSSRSASCENKDRHLHITNGSSLVSGVDADDATQIFFMDDRSTKDSQGVFIMSRSGTGRKFYHFWDNEQPVDVTEDILEGLGFTTPQQRVSIQCIGVI